MLWASFLNKRKIDFILYVINLSLLFLTTSSMFEDNIDPSSPLTALSDKVEVFVAIFTFWVDFRTPAPQVLVNDSELPQLRKLKGLTNYLDQVLLIS